MLISLHKQATTPKIRAAIQASDEPAWIVAERYGISEQTVWRHRPRPEPHGAQVAEPADTGAGGRGGLAETESAAAARRPARRGPRVSQPERLALRAGSMPAPMPAPSWGRLPP